MDKYDTEEKGYIDINDVYGCAADCHALGIGEFDEEKFEDMQGMLYDISDEKISRYDMIEFLYKMNYVEPSEEEQNREMLKAGEEEMNQEFIESLD
jgi:Mn-containing catalase